MADELVLIVDDNEKNLRLARDVLAVSRVPNARGQNGAEGIALALEHRPM